VVRDKAMQLIESLRECLEVRRRADVRAEKDGLKIF